MTEPLIFNPYTWRKRKYKTVSGLCSAVNKVYPRARVSFGELEMHVTLPNMIHIFDVARHPDLNEVCDQPKTTRAKTAGQILANVCRALEG